MKKRYTRAAAAVAALVLAAVTVWCGYALETEDWIISSPYLPDAFDGLRIALLSDVHGAEYGEGNSRLLAAVRESEPDLIALSGDLVDEFTDLDMLEPLLNGLTSIAPAYYVTGNHEWARDDTESLLERIASCGVTVLRNEYILLTRDGESIVLLGIEDENAYAEMETPAECMARVRAERGEEAFVLALFHRNDQMEMWSELGADAVLAGHGHGGLVRLPLIGGLLGVDRRPFPDDCEGLYTQGRTTLAVSRGAGGVRLWNRPHIPTVVLTRTDEA